MSNTNLTRRALLQGSVAASAAVVIAPAALAQPAPTLTDMAPEFEALVAEYVRLGREASDWRYTWACEMERAGISPDQDDPRAERLASAAPSHAAWKRWSDFSERCGAYAKAMLELTPRNLPETMIRARAELWDAEALEDSLCRSGGKYASFTPTGAAWRILCDLERQFS